MEHIGLTDAEVEQRIEQGLTNHTDISTDKTTKEIIVSNVCTYFNLIFLVITILLVAVGSFRNLTFLPIIIGNTVIGIVRTKCGCHQKWRNDADCHGKAGEG